MITFFSFLCLVGGVALLVVLALIDLRICLLPNAYVFSFGVLGPLFHLITAWRFADPLDLALGTLIGGGSLYVIRWAAQRFYGPDALGLGDVKLMLAAGLWLGTYYISLALAAGALAGILHGLGISLHYRLKTGRFLPLQTLSLPAGPGFIIGILAAGVIKFWTLPQILSG